MRRGEASKLARGAIDGQWRILCNEDGQVQRRPLEEWYVRDGYLSAVSMSPDLCIEWIASATYLRRVGAIVTRSDPNHVVAGLQDGEGLEVTLAHWPSLLGEPQSASLVADCDFHMALIDCFTLAASGDEQTSLVDSLVVLDVL